MGSGKSCLTYAVINDVTSMVKIDGSMIAYVYCDRTTPATQQDISSVDRILRCIVKQLAQPSGNGRLMNEVVEIYNGLSSKAELTADDCVQLIGTLADQSILTTIIIDGLDECPRDTVQGDLVDNLIQVLLKCSKPVHVFVSSRPEQQIYDLLEDKVSYHISTEGLNVDDIQHLIRAKVEESAANRYRRLYSNNNQERREYAIKILTENALEMF